MNAPTNKAAQSLAHYTNLDGLRGIIESGRLRASNVAFLNDREELVHGIKCAKRAVSTMLKDAKLRQWKEPIAQIAAQIENGRLPNTYAACFCEKSDLLSQWRGYGGKEQGVCLVFEARGLEAMRHGKRSFLSPVQYGLINGKAALRDSLRTRLLAIDVEDFTAMDDAGRARTVYDVVSELIPRFKHKGFEAELEWRLVVQHETLRSSVQFRTNGNVLVPFIELGEGELPLKYVRIGPGSDPELTQRSVETFLAARGYEVEVVMSRVPFRT
jgi:hypothetical protein